MTDQVLHELLGGRTAEQVLSEALRNLQARAVEGRPAAELESVTERHFVHGPVRPTDDAASASPTHQ